MIRRRLLCLLPLLFSASDSVTSDQPYRIHFLGDGDREAEKTYQTFIKAVERFQPQLAARIRFRFVNLKERGSDIDAAVRLAMAQRPDMLVALNGMYAAAAARNCGNTPVVFASYEDPIRQGIVSDMLARLEPICGISLADALEGKRLEILRRAFPRTRGVAVLADRIWAESMEGRARVEEEARRQGLRVAILLAEDAQQLRALFSEPRSAQFDAWYIPATRLADITDSLIFEQLRAWKKPSIWALTEEVSRGAQMAYSQETRFVWASIAELIARVHAGEPAGSIPILRPQHFTLTIRMMSDTGMPAPDISIVRRADIVLR